MSLTMMSLVASGQDSVQKELDRAKATFQKEKEAYRDSVLDSFDKREESARKAADKKLLDLIKSERDAYENWHATPTNVSPAASKRRTSSRSRMESAFNAAIKSYIRANNDEAAAAVAKELREFLRDDWAHLDLGTAAVVGDVIRIPVGSSVATIKEFSGPIEIRVVARTEKDNIRLYAINGANVIFNHETKPETLYVGRPDELDGGGKGGSPVSVGTKPMKPGVWYKIRWRITNEEMQIFVNDETVFAEKRKYNLSAGKSQVSIKALTSVIEVRDFHVISLTKD